MGQVLCLLIEKSLQPWIMVGTGKPGLYFQILRLGTQGIWRESLGEPMNSVLLKVLQWIQAQGVWGRRHITLERRLEIKVKLPWTGRPLSVTTIEKPCTF